jgi:hypothetical protein
MDNEVNSNDQPQLPAGDGVAPEGSGQPRPNGGGGGKKFWRRRRKFRPAGAQGQPSNNGGGGQPKNRQQRFQKRRGATGQQRQGFTGPMDHSYREANGNSSNNGNGNANAGGFQRFNQNGRGRNDRRSRFGRGFQQQGQQQQQPPSNFGYDTLQPVVANADDLGTRIYVFVDDLFFLSKIQETARKLNIKIGFVKTLDDMLAKVEEEGGAPPKLVILDLAANTTKPLTVIPKIYSKFKKETSILGFVPHIAGELKAKAQEAGCSSVMPRSAFSSNLPNILRRYATDGQDDADDGQP